MTNTQGIRHLKRHGFFTTLLKSFLKFFIRKPRIIGTTDLPKPAIIIANHKGAAGPMVLSLYFPCLFVPWGHYQMTEGYRRRFDYLYRVFYRQKLKKGKFVAFWLALLFGLVSKLIYNGMRVIPSYPDIRVRKTLKISEAHLDQGNSVLVFPEDSRRGYEDLPATYFGGFAALAIDYWRRHGRDVPIIPVYFSKQERLIIIGESCQISELLKRGLDREQITLHFAKIARELPKRQNQDINKQLY